MTIDKALFILAGSMVIVSTLLAMLHSPNWHWFTLFIGANMIQSSFTGFCPPAFAMRKLGMKTSAEQALETGS
ncbi:MAG TPA: DUF2892 domain-containing protein [Gammaproteobacteria bacterium]|nr:DUF2892 domain-containing protein [Gammaproteobacteria bacterium]